MTRACGDCGRCCKLLAIPVLSKPAGAWCQHWCGGCSIYPDRPSVCQIFACQWLIDPALGDEWYPPRAKMFLYLDGGVTPNLLRVLVDAGGHGRWRESPYREAFARLSAAGLRRAPPFHTVVQLGQRVWLITPIGETEVTGMTYTIDDDWQVATWR